MPDAPPPPSLVTAAEPPPAGALVCPNCGRSHEGRFCTACGQKHIREGDLSLRHAWHHVVHELFHLDGKVFHSLQLLFTRPGQITLDFFEGRRARHVHPIRLYLVFASLFFLLSQFNPAFDVRGAFGRMLQEPARQTLERSAARKGQTAQQLIDRGADRVAAFHKTANMSATLLSGVAMWLLFRRRRPYLAEHMVTVMHLASFNMGVWLTLGWLNYFAATRTIGSVLVPVLVLGYFLVATRRVYGGNWALLILKWAVVELFKVVVVFAILSAVFVRTLKS